MPVCLTIDGILHAGPSSAYTMKATATVSVLLRAHWLAAAVFVALAVLHTWPLATNPAALSLNHNGDAQLNEWILAWVVHQLPRDPVHLFDANIFYPAKASLAFSEPLILPAIMGAPVFWFGGSPVLAYNLLLLTGFVLTALAAYAVICSWTQDRSAAVLAGALFAFNTHMLTRLPHLQAVHAYGLPLALLFADRLIRLPQVKVAAGLALVMTTMVYTSGYLVVFATVVVAIALITEVGVWRTRARPVIGGFALATIVTTVLALPVAIPYRRVAVEQGMVRTVANVRQFSASPKGYLTSSGRLHYSTWGARFWRKPADTFFPGVVAVALAGVAVWRTVRTGVHASRMVLLGSLAITGVVLSLGPRTPVYEWLFTIFPPMQGLRAAARFGNLFLLAVALAAGLGLAALRQTGRQWHRSARAMAIAAVLVATVETLCAPIEYRRFGGIPRLYDLLATETAPVVLAEMPFYPGPAAFHNAEYVLNSTAHWRPLLNGYSGYTPASYRRLASILWYFPREHAIQAMRDAGVTHFTVHPDRLGIRKTAETIDILSRRADVELLAIAAGSGIRLYRFR